MIQNKIVSLDDLMGPNYSIDQQTLPAVGWVIRVKKQNTFQRIQNTSVSMNEKFKFKENDDSK